MAVIDVAKSENLPCCTLVAMWSLEQLGHEITSVSQAAKIAGDEAWQALNVWDGSKPWSALTANATLLGGVADYQMNVTDSVPALTPGRYHVIQRWKGLSQGELFHCPSDDMFQAGAQGHTYLAYSGGDYVKIIQSSIKRGYRVDLGGWEGNAGLAGYDVGILTLPAGVGPR